ncbi:aminoglycoside phosphotransferase family protein [Erwinia typographi]|uniref:aminoglycoside phosphotransferase family protein n=1 Tax=Erwinia typographi TaxID=371042 RepID=UPI002FC38FFB
MSVRYVQKGHDTEACRILCLTAQRLHTCQKQPLPQLISLHDWFHSLKPAARIHGGILKQCAELSEL